MSAESVAAGQWCAGESSLPAEGAEEIDVERADRARQRAEKRLQDWMNGDETVDHARALSSVQRAMARLNVARKGE